MDQTDITLQSIIKRVVQILFLVVGFTIIWFDSRDQVLNWAMPSIVGLLMVYGIAYRQLDYKTTSSGY